MSAYFSKRNLQFLLHEVFRADDLTQYPYFEAHDRSTFDMAIATNAAYCKAIWITWKCSRTFVAPAVNADNLTTANIVLRMK